MRKEYESGLNVLELDWFIRLRWFAVAGLFVAPFAAERLFNLDIMLVPLGVIAACVLVYNFIFFFALGVYKKNPLKSDLTLHANAQISLDLLALTAILHFTGGAENPFLFFYIFHVVISGIILPLRYSVAQTVFATMLFLSLIWLEWGGAIQHHAIGNFLGADIYNKEMYLIGVSLVFASVMFISLYMVSYITRKIVEREQELENANRLLQEKDRVKSEYVLRVSHDIKGHLAAIQSCIYPVQSGMTGELTEGQKNLLDRAESRTEKLLAFVKDLLNLTIARLKEQKDTDEFDIEGTAREAVELVLPTAKNKGISINTEFETQGARITGSRAEIKAVFLELLSNAVKYTPFGGHVIAVLSADKSKVTATIADTGVGIPKEELTMIFDEFYRSTRTAPDASGSGLGLAMTKHVIEKHGGTIFARPGASAGTEFVFTLPI